MYNVLFYFFPNRYGSTSVHVHDVNCIIMLFEYKNMLFIYMKESNAGTFIEIKVRNRLLFSLNE